VRRDQRCQRVCALFETHVPRAAAASSVPRAKLSCRHGAEPGAPWPLLLQSGRRNAAQQLQITLLLVCVPSWLSPDGDRASFVAANGQALACVYFEEEPGRRSADCIALALARACFVRNARALSLVKIMLTETDFQ
jgi:hypothetical protein